MVVEYEICKLLLVEKKIKNAGDLVNGLEEAIRGGCPIIVVAEDIEQEPLATLVVNKLRGSLKIVAVKAPSYECFKDVDIKVDTTILGLDDEIQRSLHDALNGVMEDRYSVLITLVNQFAADGFYYSYNDNIVEPICSEFDGQQDGEISQNDQPVGSETSSFK